MMEKVFKLKFKEEDVKIETENGTIIDCIIREMNGSQRDDYMEIINQRIEYTSDGKFKGLSTTKGLYIMLLSKTLIKKSDGKVFSEKDLNEFPAGVLAELFTISQQINGLDEDSVDEAKNV